MSEQVFPKKRRVQGRWMGFSASTGPEEATRLFKKRYERSPDEIIKTRAIVLAGPLQKEEGR